MKRVIGRLLERFPRDNKANVAVIAALSAIPVFGMLGVAMDYGTALSNKSKLDNAADEAALVAVKTAAAVVQGGGAFSTGQAQGIAQAQMAFAASAGKLGFSSVPSISPTITMVSTRISAQVVYTTSVTANFTKMLGFNTIPLKGTAAATASLTTYTNYYVLIDTSESMGIGSTSSDMQNLYNATASGSDGSCVFGCHGHYNSNDTSPDYETMAHNAGITLRIDSAKAAVRTMITQAQNTPGNNGNIQIGLYTMTLNGSGGPYYNTVASPSSNYSSLSSAANGIDLPLYVNSGAPVPGWTDENEAVSALAAMIPASGTGLTASSPINYAIIIGDGFENWPGNCGGSGTACQGTLSLSSCQALQAKATVGTIYTTYLPIYNGNNPADGLQSFYANVVGPYASQLGPAMQQCASSSSLSFQASDGPGITTALKQLFASTNQALALNK